MLMLKVAVMGDRESIAAFSALGFDTFEITDGKTAAKKLRDISNDYGVIYIIEKDKKAILYAHDTGYFLDETWEYIEKSNIKFWILGNYLYICTPIGYNPLNMV